MPETGTETNETTDLTSQNSHDIQPLSSSFSHDAHSYEEQAMHYKKQLEAALLRLRENEEKLKRLRQSEMN